MKKMNRRDYLKKIGAGAGLLVASRNMDIFAQKRRRGTRRRATPVQPRPRPKIDSVSQKPTLWTPPTDTWPDANYKFVKLIFMGLMGFTHIDDSHCEVGFHSTGDSTHHHSLSIHGYDADCNNRGEWEDVKGNTIDIAVDNEALSGISYYQLTANVNSRADLKDAKDFRWIIDFDSDYLYGKHFAAGTRTVRKKAATYKPKLVLKNGIFHTLRKTASTFWVQPAQPPYPPDNWISELGNVADIIGVNIYLKDNGKITLSYDSKRMEIPPGGEIYFHNHCFKSNPNDPCTVEPNNVVNRKKRSDFYLNYDAFYYDKDMKEQTYEYELFLRDSYLQTASPEIKCEKKHFDEMSDRERRLTDEAPCAATGYGDSK